MEKPKIFQMVVMGIFAVFIIIGMLAFSGKLPLPKGGEDVNYGKVTLWGTYPASVVQGVINTKFQAEKSVTINYVAKNKSTFDRDFLEALASGTGPDLFLIGQDEILRNLNKITLIPYQTIPERDFKNKFIEEGDMFMRPGGIVAIPFTIDPLVMYWNRDIFTNVGIIMPPTKWEEFYSLAPRVLVRGSDGSITRSFTSLGEYSNISNAKEIVSTLIMQSGNPIVSNRNGILVSELAAGSGTKVAGTQSSANQAINFFTQFSKEDKDSYSWNRSLPLSRSQFEAGDLAVYFGFASEYSSIAKRNPHLNFDVALIPQAEKASTRITFGHMQGIAVVKSSRNTAGAIYAALLLSRSDVVGAVAEAAGLPPVRRDLLSMRPSNAVFSIFYDSAIIARAWHDPVPKETDQLFRRMIDDVNSGRLKISEALSVTQGGINNILSEYR